MGGEFGLTVERFEIAQAKFPRVDIAGIGAIPRHRALDALDQRPALRQTKQAFGLSGIEDKPSRFIRAVTAVTVVDRALTIGCACKLDQIAYFHRFAELRP